MNEYVSVVMPCYNDGKYIKEAIDSVKAQTYPFVELIIVDDGSDDRELLASLKALAEEDGIRVLYADHGGPAAARNKGIEAAKGRYILPLDSDDKIAPTYIEKAVKAYEEHENVGIVYCKAELFGERSGPWDLGDFSIGRMLVRGQIFVTSLFSKADWQAVGGFSEELKAGIEDYDFWLSLLELGREVYQIDEVLFFYRQKPVSRNTEFAQDSEAVADVNAFIFEKHKALYDAHIHEYVDELRKEVAWLEQENNAMRKSLSFISKLSRIPFVHKLSVWAKEKLK